MDGLLKNKITKINYHHDCWLGVTIKTFLLLRRNCKIQACWSCAVVTTITTILVWCKCKGQHRWLDISISNMNTSAGPLQVFSDMHACRCKFNRHDCWLGATVKDMTNGRMQLLQTWLMAGCKHKIHGC